MITLAQLLITLVYIIGKTKLLLHQTLLIKLMTLSRIMKNIQAFGIQKQNIEVSVISHFVKQIIQDLKTNKAVGNGIPTKISKEREFTFDVFTKCINKSIENGYFPNSLKGANNKPLFKKEDPLDKSNYRPVSILPLLPKVYVKVIYH